jgi:hypothetical protein
MKKSWNFKFGEEILNFVQKSGKSQWIWANDIFFSF